ncbi:protein of unknown function [Beijerinckiaceae bacterium RH AL1]|jgi:hypothetical protein|nr:hypothetical protein [Beijerinckiaceae bacterium]VVB43212.1 protein of unknown function [Beijerinckiaceae bacterium RH AL8]VVB43227.1 protein of unknown function [Beijerinckiaceae bacterium RH CH11]VVC53727.1 protein of unknown function [Beijerinckiaceae bacterium RH AL1]
MTNDPPKAAASAINLKLIPHYSDDPRPVLVRLADYCARGTDSPESLNLYEIRQVSFALSLYLARYETP